jgi:Na+-translocating ferredoxin:NAD+ oxidoreductase RnfG subunit
MERSPWFYATILVSVIAIFAIIALGILGIVFLVTNSNIAEEPLFSPSLDQRLEEVVVDANVAPIDLGSKGRAW